MDYREYQKQFREDHALFYKELRSYFRYKSPEFIFKDNVESDLNKIIKKLSENKQKLYEGSTPRLKKKALYNYLLKQHIKNVFENSISNFLRDVHSLTPQKTFHNLTLRGIIYLHSDEFGEGEPLSIPFGKWKQSNVEEKITSEVFNLRHSVKHFIGEAIWRFFEPGELNTPLLVFNETRKGFNHTLNIKMPEFTNKGELKQKLLKDKEIFKDWPNKFYQTLSQYCDNWQQKEDAIIKETVSILNSWLPSITCRKDKGKTVNDLVFLIDGHRDYYRGCDCRFLLANPIRQYLINDVTNIIYIPDIHRNKITGGLVCELSIDALELNESRFEDMLKDLQWIISDYIISPISSCEAEFNTGKGETYIEKYFSNIAGFEKFKEQILRSLKDLRVYTPNPVLEEANNEATIYHALKYFLESVSTKRGNAIRGYREISQKAFVTVCKLWNALYAYELTGGMIIPDSNLKEIEVDVRAFNKIEDSQPALHLIYLALDFEGTLKNVPSYREHFIHSFHVYCLGMWLALNPNHPYQSIFSENSYYYQQWYIAALWHDISYALQKLPDISNIFIRNLISHGYYPSRKKELVPIAPSWGHLLLVKDFYKLLLGESNFKKSIENIFSDFKSDSDKANALGYIKNVTNDNELNEYLHNETKVKKTKNTDKTLKEALSNVISDMLLERMLSEADHCVLSGLILYHQMCNTDEEMYKKGIEKNKTNYGTVNGIEGITSLFNLIKCSNKHKENEPCPKCMNHAKFIEVIVAIMLHSAYSWTNYDPKSPPWRINLKNAPIAHLLMLCDTFVQSGRDFSEADDKMKIHFKSLDSGSGETASILLNYYKKAKNESEDSLPYLPNELTSAHP